MNRENQLIYFILENLGKGRSIKQISEENSIKRSRIDYLLINLRKYYHVKNNYILLLEFFGEIKNIRKLKMNEREKCIFELLIIDMSIKEISNFLSISEIYIKLCKKNMCKKKMDA